MYALDRHVSVLAEELLVYVVAVAEMKLHHLGAKTIPDLDVSPFMTLRKDIVEKLLHGSTGLDPHFIIIRRIPVRAAGFDEIKNQLANLPYQILFDAKILALLLENAPVLPRY